MKGVWGLISILQGKCPCNNGEEYGADYGEDYGSCSLCTINMLSLVCGTDGKDEI